MELIRVGEKTYYIKNNTNIGIYKIDDENVCLIDTGNDKEAGKKILKIVTEQGWKVKCIVNTHSHADHIGGNNLIQDRTSCSIYALDIEKSFVEYPILEPSLLYGANPISDLKNKFLYAKESKVENIENNLPDGLEYVSLCGHSPNLIGIKTDDNVLFIGDSIASDVTISKYHLFYIFNVKEYLQTLDLLEHMEARMYIASHCEATEDIKKLIKVNREKINEISQNILEYLEKEATFEDIQQFIFNHYNLVMNINQYVLIGSTIKAYLTYLYEENKIKYEFIDNKMMWKKI